MPTWTTIIRRMQLQRECSASSCNLDTTPIQFPGETPKKLRSQEEVEAAVRWRRVDTRAAFQGWGSTAQPQALHQPTPGWAPRGAQKAATRGSPRRGRQRRGRWRVRSLWKSLGSALLRNFPWFPILLVWPLSAWAASQKATPGAVAPHMPSASPRASGKFSIALADSHSNSGRFPGSAACASLPCPARGGDGHSSSV